MGIDVGEHVAKFLTGALGPRIEGGTVELTSELVNAGIKGRKTSRGFFLYTAEKKGAARKVNEEAVKIIAKYHSEAPSGV